MIADPIVKEHEGVLVVRDDLIRGGSKRRFVDRIIAGHDEVVYATPAYGGAQIAIAYAASELGVRSTIFVAKRGDPHPRTLEAKRAGARILQVPYGYLSNVQSKAKEYCQKTGATLLPFGLDTPEIINAIAAAANKLQATLPPIDQVWCVAGSGVLSKSLQKGFTNAKSFHVISVGKGLSQEAIGKARLYKHPKDFAVDAKIKPPFPSCSNYDAKAWEYIKRYGKGTILFWNVMG